MPALPDHWLSCKPRQIAGRRAVCIGGRGGEGGHGGSVRLLAAELEVVRAGGGRIGICRPVCGGQPPRPVLAFVHPYYSGQPEFATPFQRRQGTAKRWKLPQTVRRRGSGSGSG